MGKSQGTSGPWQVHPEEPLEICTEDLSGVGRADDWSHAFEDSPLAIQEALEASWANARLMAAAPDLLDALQKVIACGPALIALGDKEGWAFTNELACKVERLAAAKAEGRAA